MIFIETPAFERMREGYLNDDQYRLLQAALMADPESGDLIRGIGWYPQSAMGNPWQG